MKSTRCGIWATGKVRAAGVAMAMQGSGISGVDVGSATVKLSDDGSYNLIIGAADMGTGCDTILAQMVAECMDCDLDNVAVFGADSDASPYDSGSYASSTTYVTGKAVEKACQQLKAQLCTLAAGSLGCTPDELEFTGKAVRRCDGTAEISLADLAISSQCNNNTAVQVTATHSSPVSPPPFMVGMAEIELDKETGSVQVLDYKAVVDCGTPINPNLARVQTEGGIVQGIGMALYENVTYSDKGRILENSLMQYKIPTGWTWAICRWNSSPATSPPGPSAPSPSARSSSTRPPGHRPRHLPGHRAVVPGTAHHPGKNPHGAAEPGKMTHLIYLAAGASRRFGADKLLADCHGRPLFSHGLQTLAEVCAGRRDADLTVVTNTPAIAEAARALGARAVPSPQSALGQSYSIRAGLDARGTAGSRGFPALCGG